MRIFCGGMIFTLLGIASVCRAEESKLIEESWETVSLGGQRIGSFHTTIHRAGKGASAHIEAACQLDITIRRRGAAMRVRMEQGTVETPDGKVLRVSMKQQHPGGRQLWLIGVVDEDVLKVGVDKGDGSKTVRRTPWPDGVVGIFQLEHLFELRKPKVGDRFTIKRYEPIYNSVLTIQVAALRRETVSLPGGPRQLLRLEMTPDKLEGPGLTVRPTKVIWWLDGSFTPARRQFELEGLGAVTLTKTNKGLATAPVTATVRGDIGLQSLLPLNRTLPNAQSLKSVLYRVTARVEDPANALVSDSHQEVRKPKGNVFELVVHPVRPDEEAGAEPKPAADFLASTHYIDSDDARLKELAEKAAGPATDPWKKALRLEKWVHNNMRVDNVAPMVRASAVARTLRGDCRHYALLTAALCRAEGIPSRTAMGLVYVERSRKPYLGFHMWTEVWVNGRWLGLDATLGKGGVGAGHVKICDHSWQDAKSLTPLLPVSRVMGKLGIQIIRTESGE
jgi:hypothetical protein